MDPRRRATRELEFAGLRLELGEGSSGRLSKVITVALDVGQMAADFRLFLGLLRDQKTHFGCHAMKVMILTKHSFLNQLEWILQLEPLALVTLAANRANYCKLCMV